MHIPLRAFIGILGVFVLVAACAPAAPAQPTAATAAKPAEAKAAQGTDETAQRYEAGKKEGRVLIIGPGTDDQQAVFDAFQKKYTGIAIEAITARGPEMLARLDAEIASGQRQLSVWSVALSSTYNAKKRNALEKWEPPAARTLAERFKNPEGWYRASAMTPYGILTNTNLVPSGQGPQSWKDLADPKWKGKIVSDDPRTAGGGQIVTHGFIKDPALGWSYVEQLAKQEIRFSRDRNEIVNSIARGEFAVNYPASVRDYVRLKEANAPVELVLPKDGSCECSTGYVSLLKDAPHPNAARLLVNFYFTEEGQKALVSAGHFPTMPGIAGPEGYPATTEIKLLPPLTEKDLDDLDNFLAKIETIFFK
jgi:iron(III) transport system substrate-binding protein